MKELERYTPVVAVIIAVAVVAGCVVRFLASTGDLWLDEVWTLELLRGLTSPVYVLTGIHHDNNHYLNSLYLYYLGFAKEFHLYRGLSLSFGLGTVLCGIAIAMRRGRLEALLTAIVLSGSFPLILYSSEARGYAGAMFFSLASLLLMQRRLDGRGRGTLVVFWLCSVLGFLSHLTYGIVFAALGIWSIAELKGRGASPRAALLELAGRFAIPTTFLAWLYWIDLRLLWTGGGPARNLARTVLESMSYGFRLPLGMLPEIWMGGLALVISLAAIAHLWRRRDSEWVFYLAVISLGPLLGLAKLVLQGPQPFVMRHFVVGLVFMLLLVSFACATIARQHFTGALVCALAIVLLMIGNGQVTLRLLEHGRGNYLQALRDINARSPGPIIFVAGDQETQLDYLMSFYSRYLGDEKTLVLVPRRDWRQRPPEWFISHPLDPWRRPNERLTAGGMHFEFVKVYPSILYSGWPWAVYRRSGG